LTRRSHQFPAERRELPWVPIEKEYSFGTGQGPRTLSELFDGRSQLIVYHFMVGRPTLRSVRSARRRQTPSTVPCRT
jgi:predicted dithiol-disulfide oxidoreductase (DUF899 family)